MNPSKKRPVIGVFCNLLDLSIPELRGICSQVDTLGMEVQILPLGVVHTDCHRQDFMNRAASFLASPRLDGLICFTRSLMALKGRQFMQEVLADWKNRPMVSLGEQLFQEPCIFIDQIQGLRMLLDHLFGHHRYRTPAFILAPGDSADARTRNEAFREAVERHGLDWNNQYQFTGNWSLESGHEAVRELFDQRSLKPDILICANDFMALGARDELQRRGLMVPDDVALSGFDGVILSDNIQAPLASVGQPGLETGRLAMEMIQALLEGRKVQNRELSSQFIPRPSCGCIGTHHPAKYRKLQERVTSMPPEIQAARIHETLLDIELMGHLLADYRFRHIENMTAQWIHSFLEDKDIQAHNDNAKLLFDAMGSGYFYMTVFEEGCGDLPARGRLVLAREYWKHKDLQSGGIPFNPRTLLPEEQCPERPCALINLPLRSGDRHLGNMAFELEPGMEHSIYTFCERISAAVLWLRENNRLQELNKELEESKRRIEALSLCDEMTSLHNRRGFMTLAKQQIQYCRRMKQGFWIIFLDLDGLKIINDTWGHDEGDEAIRLFGTLLKSVFRESDIMARIGGDEFTVLVSDADAQGLDHIRSRLQEALEQINHGHDRPWILSMSMGSCRSDPGSKLSLDQMMKEADQELYREKRKKHAGHDHGWPYAPAL